MKTRSIIPFFLAIIVFASCQPFPTLPITQTPMVPPTSTITPIPPATLTPIPSSTTVPSVTLTPTTTPSEPLEPKMIATLIALSNVTQVVNQDFDKPSTNPGSTRKGSWNIKIEDGNGLLEVKSPISGGPGNLPGYVFGSQSSGNYLIGFRYKVTECKYSRFFYCIIVVTFRNEIGGAYVLIINSNFKNVEFYSGGLNGWKKFNKGIFDTKLDIPKGSWHNVLISADRERISASIDDKLTTSAKDDRFRRGEIGIEVGAGVTVQLDNINLWDIPYN